MSTPARGWLGAMFAQLIAHVTALIWFTIRTTPGLVLITVGSLAGLADHPWWGLAVAAGGAWIYAEQCSRTPYSACVRCHGNGYRNGYGAGFGAGRRFGASSHSRNCRHCRAKGVRMRWGRALMNRYRRATYSATPAPAARQARPLAPGSYADALRDSRDSNHPGGS